MVNTGGAQRHPADTARLKNYWAHGKGSIAIAWGTDGDHTRCVRLVNEAIVERGGKPLPDHEIHGFCTNVQKMAIGHAGNQGQSSHGH